MKKKVIWIDFNNVPHVNFMQPIIRKYEEEYDFVFSLRDFAETKGLFEKRIGRPYIEVGVHQGGNKLRKIWGVIERYWAMRKTIPYFDVKISCGGDASSFLAKSRGKISVTFDDNEMSPNWRYAPFADLSFFPSVIDTKALRKQFFTENKLYQYHGYKEDFYLADYEPNLEFLKQLPFEHYVVVRPENIKASYVAGKQSIVPELLKALEADGYNILFLPRYDFDKDYAKDIKNIFIPKEAVNGLDACYYADAILTGAGTMAREAACLGVPSVSFFAGTHLLTVDQSLVDQGKMFFSRDVDAIMNFVRAAKDRSFEARGGGLEGLARCKAVQAEIFAKLDEILK